MWERLRGWAAGSDCVCRSVRSRVCLCVCLACSLWPRQASRSAPVNSAWGKCQWPRAPHLGHRLTLRSRRGPCTGLMVLLTTALRWAPFVFPHGPQWPGGMCAQDGPQNGRGPLPASGFRLRLGLGPQVDPQQEPDVGLRLGTMAEVRSPFMAEGRGQSVAGVGAGGSH